MSAGRSFLHTARIQQLGKDTPRPTPSCLRPLLPFQDGTLLLTQLSGDSVGTLDLFPSLEQPQSQYQQADAGDELAEATPKSLCPFLSPAVLWDAQMVLWQAGHRAAEPHLPVAP